MEKQIVFARARPKSCKITETYCYEQEIAKNPDPDPKTVPDGNIEIEIPYDGDQCVPKLGYLDVRKQIKQRKITDPPLRILIGHLGLNNYPDNFQEKIPEFIEHHESIPLIIPAANDRLLQIHQLHLDRSSVFLKYPYTPPAPDVAPINISVHFYDEECSELYETGNFEEAILADIQHPPNFFDKLKFKIQVELQVPEKLLITELKPKINTTSLEWPNIASSESISLYTKFASASIWDKKNPANNENPKQFYYNPLSHSLEWKDVIFHCSEKKSISGFITFESDPVILGIGYPGELYEQERITGEMEIEIPNILFSGMQARLFDYHGEVNKKVEPELKTKFKIKFSLNFNDVLARRVYTPYQLLQFDEIEPDEMRVVNIQESLDDRGFQIVLDRVISNGSPSQMEHLLMAQRVEGSQKMTLWIYIHSKNINTERKTTLEGGRDFKSYIESGRMKVSMRGCFPGDYKALLREMNCIQDELHKCFQCIRARH